MIILVIVLGFIILINFFTIRNLSHEKTYYKEKAIGYGQRITGGSKHRVSLELDREWHNSKGGKIKETTGGVR